MQTAMPEANEPKRQAARGAPDLQRSNILVVGLARNCARHIETDIAKLRLALASFPNLYWLVIESDSSDDTNKRLEALALQISNFRHLSLGALRKKMPFRTERIAHCRNKYLQEIRENPLYESINYMIVADLDGLNDSINEQALLSCWTRDDWDVCTANQRGPYYDVWTLRHSVWSPNDCFEQARFLMQQGISSEKALSAAVFSRMIRIPENAEWIAVDSAFGGLAIYRREVIGSARYVGLNDAGQEVGEHVAFHYSLKKTGAKIFINPKFINASYTEHTQHFLPLGQLKRKCKLLLRAGIVKVTGASGLLRFKTMVSK